MPVPKIGNRCHRGLLCPQHTGWGQLHRGRADGGDLLMHSEMQYLSRKNEQIECWLCYAHDQTFTQTHSKGKGLGTISSFQTPGQEMMCYFKRNTMELVHTLQMSLFGFKVWHQSSLPRAQDGLIITSYSLQTTFSQVVWEAVHACQIPRSHASGFNFVN